MGVVRRLDTIAPIASLAALVLAFIVGGFDAAPHPGVQDYHGRIAEAFRATPVRIGSWVGVEEEPVAAAVEILKPNVLLQRRFVESASGESVSLLLTHCGDARDMIGHYPPACYPANGWTLTDQSPETVVLWGTERSATRYRFQRTQDGEDLAITVLNFFILPAEGDAEVLPDMGPVVAASRSPQRAGLGAAQVQILTRPSMPEAQRAEISMMFLEAVAPALRTVAEGPK